MAFDIDAFVADCREARSHPDGPERLADLLRDAVADPAAIAAAIDARQAGMSPRPMVDWLFEEDGLRICQIACLPQAFGVPHDHAGWAVIGVYSGTESFNVYEEREGGLRKIRRDVLDAPTVEILPADLIHDMENPSPEISGSLHIYGSARWDGERRIWRDENSPPEAFAVDKAYAYGMAHTQRRRKELGIEDLSLPSLSELIPGLSQTE
jgi:predicted metal-dependent enzyme (double-stranded beta helix superfamily)